MSTLCNLLHDIKADSKNWLPNPLISGLHAQLREPKIFYWENQKHLYMESCELQIQVKGF